MLTDARLTPSALAISSPALARGIADEQPAEQPSHHAGHSEPFAQDAHLFRKPPIL